jgi:hypothetical protein
MNDVDNIDELFAEIKDDILDEYNNGIISKKEMINIIRWCDKMKDIIKKA